MKTYLTFSIATLLVLTAFALPARADHYRAISVSDLPRTARELINTHFNGYRISYASIERSTFDRSYKVIFENGTELEFDRHGAWSEIDCKRGTVPAELIPNEIRNVIHARFEGRSVQKIERTRRGYEVDLTGGIDLKFDHRFQLTGVDD